MQADFATRQQALRDLLDRTGVDAVAIVPGANMLYFTGLHVHLSERPIVALFTREETSIIIPQLEVPKVVERPDLEARVFPWTDTEGYQGAFREAIDALGLRGGKLGIDGMTMRATEFFTFRDIDPTLNVTGVERGLIGIRAHKNPDEIENMRRAVQISEAALERLLEWVQPGMTERQIAARLVDEQMALGAEGLPFEALVQSGPNSSNPHGLAGDRALGADEFLLIDYGCTVGGYPSDITRTFCLGTPTAEMLRIYDTVLAANEAGRKAAAPGVAMSAIDYATRSVIEAAGYGPYFTHRTGHGLGLDTHEPIPQIAANVHDLLEPGMAFTIEPGIYIPGLGGVRIEDNVVITDTGADVLTSFRRSIGRTA